MLALMLAFGVACGFWPGAELAQLKTALAEKTEECNKLNSQLKEARARLLRQDDTSKPAALTQNPESSNKNESNPAPTENVGVSQKSAQDKVRDDTRARAKKSWVEQQMLALKMRLNLTTEQEAQIQAILESQPGGGGRGFFRFWDTSGQTALAQQMAAVLTPAQQAAYQTMQQEQRHAGMETMATVEMNRMGGLMNLSEEQKDQVYAALYQVYQEPPPADILATPTQDGGGGRRAVDRAVFTWQSQRRTEALSKILTPQQMEIYNKQQQSQRDFMR